MLANTFAKATRLSPFLFSSIPSISHSLTLTCTYTYPSHSTPSCLYVPVHVRSITKKPPPSSNAPPRKLTFREQLDADIAELERLEISFSDGSAEGDDVAKLKANDEDDGNDEDDDEGDDGDDEDEELFTKEETEELENIQRRFERTIDRMDQVPKELDNPLIAEKVVQDFGERFLYDMPIDEKLVEEEEDPDEEEGEEEEQDGVEDENEGEEITAQWKEISPNIPPHPLHPTPHSHPPPHPLHASPPPPPPPPHFRMWQPPKVNFTKRPTVTPQKKEPSKE